MKERKDVSDMLKRYIIYKGNRKKREKETEKGKNRETRAETSCQSDRVVFISSMGETISQIM